jgi:hypothetical protein
MSLRHESSFLIVWILGVSTLSIASPKSVDDTTRRAAVNGRNPVVDAYDSWTKGRLDKGAFDGSFIGLAIPVQVTKKSKSLSLLLQPQICYFNFRGDLNGMYASTMVSAGKKNYLRQKTRQLCNGSYLLSATI